MLRVTIDAFSGRPNPSYLLEGAAANDLLRDVSRRRDAISEAGTGFDGLGLRGVTIESFDDDSAQAYNLPGIFKVGGGDALNNATSFELAERLIRDLPNQQIEVTDPETAIVADQGFVDYLITLLDQGSTSPSDTEADGAQAGPAAPELVACFIERGKFNPSFWNRPEVIGRNNCYNYASNWRTDTFAQPGKGAGQQYTALSCPEVTRAALADGCHHRFNCFPDSEKNRWLVALVVAPGWDYHWYRIHTAAEGFWGHKPGGTAARNYDNSGRVIVNPETANRGPYTHFCGYFYTCNSQAHRIR